eukprot:gnl/TRDRNA2_/TRDRNA2_134857_c1_seq1.p1 gnl/TRDRNA2_/TRDRNA2_134857_c1~~gnl/TRDRNA2_/TRDRNA2_134857_c1_seq1.p1  ORF type:complete len:256 (-),score=19.84 gnl/TRDRNA2_/TRDRNA2_134857_c1_seq1:547-1248(-)
MGQRVNYLEIGVAVLKSIHTQSHFFEGASITAFDWEDPNPVIANRWTNKIVLANWTDSEMPPGTPDLRRTKHSSDLALRYDGPNGNTMYYIAGNQFNNATWKGLKKYVVETEGPINLALSDGFHSHTAVVKETKILLSLGIIKHNPEKHFAYIWDDCSGEIRWAVRKFVFPLLRAEFSGRPLCMGFFNIAGWIGKKEDRHGTCVFSTLDLSGKHLGASQSWTAIGWEYVTCEK